MAIKLNEQLKNQIGNWQDESGETKLPFDAPVIWVLNGAAQYKPFQQQAPAMYFGGWATDSVTLDTMDKIPNGMVKHEFTPKGGETITVYSARQIAVATFGKRLSSVDKNGVRYPGYQKGASPRLQVLAILAEIDANKKRIPLYPVVLSAKGYQASNILNAINDWSAKTAKARRDFADKLPANLFWMHIGTFGNEPNYKQVGQGNAKSPITPVMCHLPETIDEKLIDARFVGEQVAQEMDALREQATAWLDAWKSAKQEQPQTEAANGFEVVPPEEPPDQEFDE